MLVAGVPIGWDVTPLINRTSAAWPSVTIGDRLPRMWRLTTGLRRALVPTLAAAIIVAVLAKFGIPAK